MSLWKLRAIHFVACGTLGFVLPPITTLEFWVALGMVVIVEFTAAQIARLQ